MTVYNVSDWQRLKSTAANRWRLYSLNPLLPADVRKRETKKWITFEEAADNALDLILRGNSLEDTAQMASDFIDWKLARGQ